MSAAKDLAWQRPSHSRLILDQSQVDPRSTRIRPLNAIIVPAARRAERLRSVATLAAEANVLLVVLASHECQVEEVGELVAAIPGCRALTVAIPLDYQHDDLQFETSNPYWRTLNGGRGSNLALKRNLGLLLARSQRWAKVLCLDDDITGVTPTDLSKIAQQLEQHQVTGLISHSYPDNSVVCHARRLSGQPQGVFISGAALGVNCKEEPLDFFPDIYNEDWLFFAAHAAAGRIVSVGSAGQLAFNPFKDPQRAVHEEFGDVIAEGLYALFSDGASLEAATLEYWKTFIAYRSDLIERTSQDLDRVHTHEAVQARKSLRHAIAHLASITAEDCATFVGAWRRDRGRFARIAHEVPALGNLSDAFAYLRLPTWREAAFGFSEVPSRYLPRTQAATGQRAAGGKKVPSRSGV